MKIKPKTWFIFLIVLAAILVVTLLLFFPIGRQDSPFIYQAL